MAAALEKLAASGNVTDIGDPVAWQREIRQDRPDLAKSVAELELLTDDELWRAARNHLSDETRTRLESLNFKQQSEGLAPAEKELLEQLIDRHDQAVLVRAVAARLLQDRGLDVSGLLTKK